MILCLSLPCFSQAFQNLFHIHFHIHWTLFSVPLKNSLFLPSKTLTDLFLFATCTWNAFIILQHMHVSWPCMLVTRGSLLVLPLCVPTLWTCTMLDFIYLYSCVVDWKPLDRKCIICGVNHWNVVSLYLGFHLFSQCHPCTNQIYLVK